MRGGPCILKDLKGFEGNSVGVRRDPIVKSYLAVYEDLRTMAHEGI